MDVDFFDMTARLAYEAADSGLLSPDLAAGIRRVKGAKKLGCRLGNWLTAEEARTLWQFPDPSTLSINHILLGSRSRHCYAIKGFLANFTLPVSVLIRWDEKAGLRGMRYAPSCSTCSRHKEKETDNAKA